MSQKSRHGKRVFDKFIYIDSFINQNAFEAKIKEQVSIIENSRWLYTNSNTGKGIIKVHRNKYGARIIAYDYKSS